ncbi:pilus assembly FimT family protein [Parapedobacter sp. 10938]|uniref:pilus assembly FimT family protein n=1 Tax=Parapedobacter flavus TaxID=3110225 RepID=UPI002DB55A18|nr:hypothetical protein [Parapedobacter sp. 10938]MEC3878631.1 hypothetical protein [Parapedobacter sp. 10938]
MKTNNLIIHKRLHASTLVEVLVALVIVTLVTATAATLFAKIVLKQPANARDLQLELKALAQRAKQEGNFLPAQFEIGRGVQVDKEVSNYQGDTLLLLLVYRAHRPGTAEETVYREIIINNEWND